MQIIIELKNERDDLFNLLSKLSEQGYRINTLFGRFIFDEKNKEVIDCGEPGSIIPLSRELVDALFINEAKLAVIFVDEKYVVFDNKFFVAIHFCGGRKLSLLSSKDVIDNFDELVVNKNKDLLSKLYSSKFKEKHPNN